MILTGRIFHPAAAVCLLMLACCSSGCQQAPEQAQAESSTDTASDRTADAGDDGAASGSWEIGPISPDELPLRIPAADQDSAADASPDDVDADSRAPGLIDTLRATVADSPIFEESGVQEELLENLTFGQDALTRIKRENRHAMREANRQLRVGAAARSPNIVLITIERIGLGDLSCFRDESEEATPHLDGLAARGTRFPNFYAGSADPQAARWCLLTGLNTGHAPGDREQSGRYTLRQEQQTIADVLWTAGYSTGFVGVWKERSLPIDHGFDEWAGIVENVNPVTPYPEHIFIDASRAKLAANADGGRELLAADFLVEEGISFIARRAAERRQFFLHLALCPELTAASEGQADPRLVVAELDSMIGRLTDWIDSSPLASRTCIVLAGESAPPSDEFDQWDASSRTRGLKCSADGLSEGNLRVPLVVVWPGRAPAGGESDHVCGVWDLLPTFSELAVAQRRPERVDGVSFAASLAGRTQREHALLYWETRQGGFGQAVRKGRWKGIRAPGHSSLALFDLLEDPAEQTDLSETRPDVVEQLVVRRN
ncbi:MAG: hypothetical protein DWQ34_05125 [Planctomycetota bacterium]|nr:MAG: hypothetical protein DWQ29_11610 [Planctomycetota bacterium]REJ95955.1 MAG: hypothetical protein DWQ34_05125 [Planctomycetota bacterium]REK29227.1 MAG: hypothetical protein DWQ41_04555 [Planctomycetota bacterium]REK29411.1 MAG: hypothetical protein DWQ45_22845 [Planctomycetota bacterium]